MILTKHRPSPQIIHLHQKLNEKENEVKNQIVSSLKRVNLVIHNHVDINIDHNQIQEVNKEELLEMVDQQCHKVRL